jgi:predicted ABC-type ATPase
MRSEDKQLIVVAGVEGSGKSTFSRIFKNSFLHSLPEMSAADGLTKETSFYLKSDLADPHFSMVLAKAKALDYKITIFYLFTGKTLASERAKLRGLLDGRPFDEVRFKKNYDLSYKGLANCYDSADVIFFLKNQKSLLFLAAYEPNSMKKEAYLLAAEKLRIEVDSLR